MDTNDIPEHEASLWLPETDPVRKAVYGKTREELSELSIVLDRCDIQGVDEINPSTGKTNRQEMEEEIADVEAMLRHLKEKFALNIQAITIRRDKKYVYKGSWFQRLAALNTEGN